MPDDSEKLSFWQRELERASRAWHGATEMLGRSESSLRSPSDFPAPDWAKRLAADVNKMAGPYGVEYKAEELKEIPSQAAGALSIFLGPREAAEYAARGRPAAQQALRMAQESEDLGVPYDEIRRNAHEIFRRHGEDTFGTIYKPDVEGAPWLFEVATNKDKLARIDPKKEQSRPLHQIYSNADLFAAVPGIESTRVKTIVPTNPDYVRASAYHQPGLAEPATISNAPSLKRAVETLDYLKQLRTEAASGSEAAPLAQQQIDRMIRLGDIEAAHKTLYEHHRRPGTTSEIGLRGPAIGGRTMSEVQYDLYRELQNAIAERNQFPFRGGRIEEFQPGGALATKAGPGEEPGQAYNRLAGTLLARLAGERATMSPTELRRVSPEETAGRLLINRPALLKPIGAEYKGEMIRTHAEDIGRQANQLTSQANKLIKDMQARGATSGEIAKSLNETFGGRATADEVASNTGWWTAAIPAPRGPHRWTADTSPGAYTQPEKALVALLHKRGVPPSEIRQALKELSGRQTTDDAVRTYIRRNLTGGSHWTGPRSTDSGREWRDWLERQLRARASDPDK